MQLGGYFFSILLLPTEPATYKKDYIVIILHHLISSFLLSTSYDIYLIRYIFSFHRVGVITALLHDVSDPLMESAKMALYFGYEKVIIFNAFVDCKYTIYYICFSVHLYKVTTFCKLRNIMFPSVVIFNWWMHAYNSDGTPFISQTLHSGVTFSLLGLEFLHLYWSYLVNKIFYLDYKNVIDSN